MSRQARCSAPELAPVQCRDAKRYLAELVIRLRRKDDTTKHMYLLVRRLLTGDEVRLGQEARILWHQHTKRAWQLAVITAAPLHKFVLLTATDGRKMNAGSCELF